MGLCIPLCLPLDWVAKILVQEVSLDALTLAHSIVTVLEEKKGEDILLLDIRERALFADYFVICSGSSDRMIQALAEAVTDLERLHRPLRGRVEGLPRDGWVVVDFGPVVVHLFSPQQRAYYNLEALWADGKVLVRVQ